jgi:hypothetical protein
VFHRPSETSSVEEPQDSPDPCEPNASSVNQEETSEHEHSTSVISTLATPPNMDLQSFSSIEVLQFLMPGFCHLSAEDLPRKVMLTCDLPQLLYEYMTYQFERLQKSEKSGLNKEPEVALLTMCGVLLNLAVMEANLVTDSLVFGEIAEIVVKKYAELQGSYCQCCVYFYLVLKLKR